MIVTLTLEGAGAIQPFNHGRKSFEHIFIRLELYLKQVVPTGTLQEHHLKHVWVVTVGNTWTLRYGIVHVTLNDIQNTGVNVSKIW